MIFFLEKEKKQKSKYESLKELATGGSIPKEILDWLKEQKELKEEISETISRILIYVSPSKDFEPEKINKWFKRGRLPKSKISGSQPATMSYLYSDIVKLVKSSERIKKLDDKVKEHDKKNHKDRTRKSITSAEMAEAEMGVLQEKYLENNLVAYRKLREIEATLGSSGML